MTEEKRKPGRPKKVVEDTTVGTEELKTQLEALQDQVDILTGALSLARGVGRESPEDKGSIGVIRIAGPAMSANLTDAYGRKKNFFWRAKNDKLYLTPAQLQELEESPGGERFLEREWLVVEGSEKEKTAVSDIGKYIDSLNLSDIDDKIGKRDDPSFLLRVLNHVETLRVVTEGPDGKPLRDSDQKVMAEIRTLDQKLRMAAEAAVSRIYELTGVRYSLSDG